jgi:hypothetical protein
MLTEFLPDRGPPPAHIWRRIEQQTSRQQIVLSRPIFWQVACAILALAVVALLVVLIGRG